MRKIEVAIGAIGCLLAVDHFIWAERAYGYIDIGSYTYAIQVLIAFILGGLVSLRVYWRKLSSFFRKDKEEKLQEK